MALRIRGAKALLPWWIKLTIWTVEAVSIWQIFLIDTYNGPIIWLACGLVAPLLIGPTLMRAKSDTERDELAVDAARVLSCRVLRSAACVLTLTMAALTQVRHG